MVTFEMCFSVRFFVDIIWSYNYIVGRRLLSLSLIDCDFRDQFTEPVTYSTRITRLMIIEPEFRLDLSG